MLSINYIIYIYRMNYIFFERAIRHEKLITKHWYEQYCNNINKNE